MAAERSPLTLTSVSGIVAPEPNRELPQRSITQKSLTKKIVEAVPGVSAALFALLNPGCSGRVEITPTSTPQPPAITETVYPTDESAQTEVINLLNSLGIEAMIPRADWPTTPEEVVEALKIKDGKSIDAKHLVRIIDTDAGTGEKVWHGWWMGEPAFPLQDGINYDAQKHVHLDANGKPVFDPLEIFKSYDQLTDEEKTDFNQQLVDVKINKDGIAVFARKGENIRDGQQESEKNTQFFFGTNGVEVKGVEQISLIPVEKEICALNVELSGATRSFRQAVVEFRDNLQVKDVPLAVKWFNPETKMFEQLDGRMLTKLTEQGVDISVLEKMPANTPLSPEDMAKRYGGQAEKWVVNPQTWEWFYESFELQPGVHYVNGVGAVDASGMLLVGAEQANSATSKMFNFNRLDTDALVQDVEGTGSFQATLFARQGTMGHTSTINHSWYTWGQGKITLAAPGIEQMTFMPHNPSWCSPNDIPNELAARARTLATEQPDDTITALYWNGSQFVTVVK